MSPLMPTHAAEQMSSLETEACLTGEQATAAPLLGAPSPTIPFKSTQQHLVSARTGALGLETVPAELKARGVGRRLGSARETSRKLELQPGQCAASESQTQGAEPLLKPGARQALRTNTLVGKEYLHLEVS